MYRLFNGPDVPRYASDHTNQDILMSRMVAYVQQAGASCSGLWRTEISVFLPAGRRNSQRGSHSLKDDHYMDICQDLSVQAGPPSANTPGSPATCL